MEKEFSGDTTKLETTGISVSCSNEENVVLLRVIGEILDAVTKAEKEITAILKQLEIDTASIVENVIIRDVEITMINDDRAQWRRYVEITLKRNPGTHWE